MVEVEAVARHGGSRSIKEWRMKNVSILHQYRELCTHSEYQSNSLGIIVPVPVWLVAFVTTLIS